MIVLSQFSARFPVSGSNSISTQVFHIPIFSPPSTRVPKDRKPIGEVCCFEAWMAEQTRWCTERWLSLSLALSVSIYLSIYLFIYLSTYQMAPHTPLWQGYFSTRQSHKTLEKHCVSQLFYLFVHFDLFSCSLSLSPSLLTSSLLPLSLLWLFPPLLLHLSILSERWLLNFLR